MARPAFFAESSMTLIVLHSGSPVGVIFVQRLAVVARQMQQAVVAARPQQARRDRRFLEREDRVVDLDAGVVAA